MTQFWRNNNNNNNYQPFTTQLFFFASSFLIILLFISFMRSFAGTLLLSCFDACMRNRHTTAERTRLQLWQITLWRGVAALLAVLNQSRYGMGSCAPANETNSALIRMGKIEINAERCSPQSPQPTQRITPNASTSKHQCVRVHASRRDCVPLNVPFAPPTRFMKLKNCILKS